jgi:hypothetical protein
VIDKLQHIGLGAGACVALLVLHNLPLGLALFLGCAIFGVFYEVQQWYRKEGQPDVWDALATALPGLIAYAALEVHKWTR